MSNQKQPKNQPVTSDPDRGTTQPVGEAAAFGASSFLQIIAIVRALYALYEKYGPELQDMIADIRAVIDDFRARKGMGPIRVAGSADADD